MLTFNISGLAGLKDFSDYFFCNILKDHKKIFFYGEVGAGKTTLIKLLCEALSVEENTSSPTFSIVNQYFTKYDEVVNHADLYRLQNVNEAYEAGIFELLADSDYLFVEWPEIIEEFVEINYIKVEIEIQNDENRLIKLHTL
jgi:tRNA threonylcarbamoyladenosine biosynthesis protein TsaE